MTAPRWLRRRMGAHPRFRQGVALTPESVARGGRGPAVPVVARVEGRVDPGENGLDRGIGQGELGLTGGAEDGEGSAVGRLDRDADLAGLGALVRSADDQFEDDPEVPFPFPDAVPKTS